MGQGVATIGLHTLSKDQAKTLMAYHARMILAYIENPSMHPFNASGGDIERHDESNREEIRKHIRQMNSIAAIHYKSGT